MSLTDTAIRNAKPKDQAYKLTDEKGLYLLVSQSGKYFRQDYRFGGKRKTLSHGVYPKLSLKEARENAMKHIDCSKTISIQVCIRRWSR